jgi:hypothetical protein
MSAIYLGIGLIGIALISPPINNFTPLNTPLKSSLISVEADSS